MYKNNKTLVRRANFELGRYSKNCKMILPPYGALVDQFKQEDGLIVCTGSNAWQRAKNKAWVNGMPKVVLPFGENPDRYKWPANGRNILVFSFGQPESYQRLIDLSKCLLQHRAIWVLWCMPWDYPAIKFERKSREQAA